jgi:hypothetical protein
MLEIWNPKNKFLIYNKESFYFKTTNLLIEKENITIKQNNQF